MRNCLLLLGLSFGLLISCSSSDSIETDDSTLLISPDTLRLTAVDSTASMKFRLSCGCPFTLDVTNIEGIEGDSSLVKFSANESLTDTISPHTISYSYSPSKATMGSHVVKFDFRAHKHQFSFTNSLVVIAGN